MLNRFFPDRLSQWLGALVGGAILVTQALALSLYHSDLTRAVELAQSHQAAQCLAGFAIFALLLDAIGIYGIVEYSVRQRKHEMGIRVALGASYSNVVTLVLRRGTLPAAVGVLLGLPVALAASGVGSAPAVWECGSVFMCA